jgi:SAM-dependent methyltransferase
VYESNRQGRTGQEILKDLSESLLASVDKARLQNHTLHIHHDFAPGIDRGLMHSRSESFGVYLSVPQGRELLSGQRVHCNSEALPFQDRVFGRVVLHHVLTDGTEAELAEAVRVLASDGLLLILGLNRQGWRYRTQGKFRALPGMAPLRIKGRLDRLEMSLQSFAGAGLLNRTGPRFMAHGLSALGVPLADVILIQARHAGGPEITPLRFRKTGAGVVQSASLSA